MNKAATLKIMDSIGFETFQLVFGLSKASYRTVRTNGSFPSSWFLLLQDMCALRGVDCPMECFNWKTAKSDDPLKSAKVANA